MRRNTDVQRNVHDNGNYAKDSIDFHIFLNYRLFCKAKVIHCCVYAAICHIEISVDFK